MLPPLALITGAARGIGFGITRAFLLAGYDVVAVDIAFAGDGGSVESTSADARSAAAGAADAGSLDAAGPASFAGSVDLASASAGSTGSSGNAFATWRARIFADLDPGNLGRCEPIACDVADEASVEAAFDAIEARLERAPDVLINNAAVQYWGPLLELSLAEWENTLRVNLTGTFVMTQHFARRRVATGGGGSIVNMGSGCNRLAFPDLSSYVASKGGVEMFTKTAALELGVHGIRVNCVAPGAIATDRTREETDGYGERWSPLTPMGRVGTVEDVARAVVTLSGEGMGFVSGETVAVDGGLFARAVWPVEY